MMTASRKRLGFFTRLLDDRRRRRALSPRHRADRACRAQRLRFGLGRAAPFPRGRRRAAGALRVPGPCRRAHLAHPARHRHRHPAAGDCRSASPRMPRCSTCSPAGGWSSASAPAATRPPSPPSASTATDRARSSTRNLDVLRTALARQAAGRRRHALSGAARRWSSASGRRPSRSPAAAAPGAAGDGLMLSRTQPRPAEAPEPTLADIQDPIIDAYLEALPPGRAPRILGSRTRVRRRRPRGGAALRRDRPAAAAIDRLVALGHARPATTRLDDLIARHRRACRHARRGDRLAARRHDAARGSTDLALQVHSVDPPHPLRPALDRAGARARWRRRWAGGAAAHRGAQRRLTKT